MTQIRISRRGLEDVLLDVDVASPLTLSFKPSHLDLASYSPEMSSHTVSLLDLEAVSVVDAPAVIPADRPHAYGYYLDTGERVARSAYPEPLSADEIAAIGAPEPEPAKRPYRRRVQTTNEAA